MRINLVVLMAIALLPFPTRLIAEAIDNDDAERAAVLFYGASLFVISLLLVAVFGYLVTAIMLVLSARGDRRLARATRPA